MNPFKKPVKHLALLSAFAITTQAAVITNPEQTSTLSFTDTSIDNRLVMDNLNSHIIIPLGSGANSGIAVNTANKTKTKIIVSTGTLYVIDNSGTGTATLMRLIGKGTRADLSGGNFSLDERKVSSAVGYFLNWDAQLHISGGTHCFLTNDDTGNNCAFHVLNGSQLHISGGIYSINPNFTTGIRAEDDSTVNLQVQNFSGVTLDGDGNITASSGTISGTLADGNVFAFDFLTFDTAKINVETIP